MEPWSEEWRQGHLNDLKAEWADCERCPLCEKRGKVVFGDGNPMADLLFIGEGPGEDEDKVGIPFVGRSGALFDALLKTVGIPREDIFVTNLVGCRTPDNRDPNSSERYACSERLRDILYIIDPLIIIPMGKVALKSLVKGGRDWAVTEYHGQLFSSPHPKFRFSGDANGTEVRGEVFPRKGENKDNWLLEYDMIPIVHPAFILRADGVEEKNMKFPPGGWATKTVDDLRYIAQFIQNIKEEYKRTPR
jgi:uracil-DNA glycosylase family 4